MLIKKKIGEGGDVMLRSYVQKAGKVGKKKGGAVANAIKPSQGIPCEMHVNWMR